MADDSLPTDPLTSADIESVYGIPIRNQRRIQGFIDRFNLIIQVRPTNPDSVPHLKAGAAPKPMVIKDKTINDLDVALGAPAHAKGLVGRFEPGTLRMPDTTGMSDTQIEALEQRLHDRAEDFVAYAADMAELAHDFVVENGIVHQKINGDKVPVTGDHDMFEILHADGTRLTPAELSLYERRLAVIGAGIMHGPHVYWNPQSSFQRARNYESIIDQHQFDPTPKSKNEPLIEFRPGTQPAVTWAAKTLQEVDREMTPWHVAAVIDGMERARLASIPGLVDTHFRDSEAGESERAHHTEKLRRHVETDVEHLRQRAAELKAHPDFDLTVFHAWADKNTKTSAPDGPNGQSMTAIRTQQDHPPLVVPTDSPEHELAALEKQAAALRHLADRRDEAFTHSGQLAAERGERTAAGIAHHTDDPGRADLARQVPAAPGYFTADVHLSDDGHALIGDHTYTPAEYGDLLRAHGWDHTTPVRLIAGNASSNGFATRLAQHLGIDVLAPARAVWIDADGSIRSATTVNPDGTGGLRISADGHWRTHHEDGTVTRSTTGAELTAAYPAGPPVQQPTTVSTARYDFRQTIDGNGRRTTEVKIRAYLEQMPGVTADRMQTVARTMIEASSQLFGDPSKAPPAALFPEKAGAADTSTPKHILLNGDGLRVDIEFVDNPEHAHLRAAIAPSAEVTGPHWDPDVPVETVVRAIGEHMGLVDATAGVDSTDINRLSHELAHAVAGAPQSTLAVVSFSHGTHSTTIGSDPAARRVTENLRNDGAHDVILHGDESGHPLDGNGAPLSPQQVADAILVNPNYVPGTPVRLVSCFSGGDIGWAQQIADRLGVPVHAPTDIVGVRQRPNSPAVVHNDGSWLTFSPESASEGRADATSAPGERTSERAEVNGRDGWDFMADESSDPPAIDGLYAIPETTHDSRSSGPPGPAPHVGSIPAGMIVGNDGLLHKPDDRADSYRTEDGRLHHLLDAPGTFRDTKFALHDGNRFVTDPLTSQDVVHKAQKEIPETYVVRDEAVREELERHSQERRAQQHERDRAGAVVKGHMAEFGIERVHDLKAAELDRIIVAKREAVLADRELSDAQVDAKLDRLDELRDNAKIYNRLGNEMVATSKAMGELGGNAYAVDSELRPNATLLSPFAGAFDGYKTIDTIAFVPATESTPPTLIGTENKGLGSPLGDALTVHGKAEQGSTEYGLHTLNIDQNLQRILTETHDEMRARGVDPDSPEGRRVIEAREDLTRALHDGTLRMEYHYVHARMDGSIEVSRFLVDGGPNTSIAAIGGVVRDAEYPYRSRDELEQVLSREIERKREALLRGIDSPDLLRAVPDAVGFSYGARDNSTIGKATDMADRLSAQQAAISRDLQLGLAPEAASRLIAAAQEQAARMQEIEIQSRIAVFRDVELGPHRDLVEKLIRLDVESRALSLTTEIKYNERVMLRDAKSLAIRFREHEDPARARFVEHMLELTREISVARSQGAELEITGLVKEYNALAQVIQIERAAEVRTIEAMGLDARHAEQLAKILDMDRTNDFGRPVEALGREIVRQGTARAVEARELPALERGRVAELALSRVQEIERTLEQGREPGPALVRETMDTLGGLVQAERAAEARTLEALGLSQEHRQEIVKTLELERAELLGRSMETLDRELVRQDHNRTVGDSRFRIGPELAKTLDVRAYRQISNDMGRAVEDRALDAGDKSRQPPVVEFDSPERRLALAANLLSRGLSLELTEARMLVEMGQGVPPSLAIRMEQEGRSPARLRQVARERERARDPRGMERGR
ncbi:hypothetical protein [Nocardia sp. NPDC023988]|uniref:hypothetical protein n=1 Tax=unclassified Nocardia TaxID=2637762 RepID=UPI0033CD1CE4